MVGVGHAGWVNSLMALWNADNLESWAARLVAVLLVLFVASFLFGLGERRRAARFVPAPTATPSLRLRPVTPMAPMAVPAAMRQAPSLAVKATPPKNRKKQAEKPLRAYKPRSTVRVRSAGAQRAFGRGETGAPGLVLFVARRRSAG